MMCKIEKVEIPPGLLLAVVQLFRLGVTDVSRLFWQRQWYVLDVSEEAAGIVPYRRIHCLQKQRL